MEEDHGDDLAAVISQKCEIIIFLLLRAEAAGLRAGRHWPDRSDNHRLFHHFQSNNKITNCDDVLHAKTEN